MRTDERKREPHHATLGLSGLASDSIVQTSKALPHGLRRHIGNLQ